MTAFHGTWEWASATDTVRIFLTTKKLHDLSIPEGFDWDRLVGWHIYKQGNVVVQNSMKNVQDVNLRTFRGGNESHSVHVVVGYLNDPEKNKFGQLMLTLNEDGKLKWQLEATQGAIVTSAAVPGPLPGFTLPLNMVPRNYDQVRVSIVHF